MSHRTIHLPWLALLCLSLGLYAGCPTSDDDATSGDDDDATADDDTGDDDTSGDDDTPADDADPADHDDTADDDDSVDDGFTHALVSTTDFYLTGALATVALDDHAVTTAVGDATTDPWLGFGEGVSLRLDGYGHDVVTAYVYPDYQTPAWQEAFDLGDNPRAGVVVQGKAFIALYGVPEIQVFDAATGAWHATIHTDSLADADGNPECGWVEEHGGSVWVSCHRLDPTWQPAVEGGLLLEIDPALEEIADHWSTDSALTCRAFPGVDELVCHEGVDLDAAWANLYEGSIFTFDPDTGVFGPDLLLESDLLANIPVFAFGPNGQGLVAAAGDAGTSLLCVDLNAGTQTTIAQDLGWIPAVDANDRGEAYVLNRSSWVSPYAGPFGVSVYDLATCADLGGAVLDLGGEPYQLTFMY